MSSRAKKRAAGQDKDETDGSVFGKMPKKPKSKKVPVKHGAWKMPPPLPVGELLTDFSGKQWRIGSSVGKGGFGEIYSASSTKGSNKDYVIKVVGGT